MKTYIVPSEKLTSECWMVQIAGLEACKNCEFLNKASCGGKKIRARLLQPSLGLYKPIGKEV